MFLVYFLPASTLSLVLAPLSSHEISFEETRLLIDGSLEVARATKGSLQQPELTACLAVWTLVSTGLRGTKTAGDTGGKQHEIFMVCEKGQV